MQSQGKKSKKVTIVGGGPVSLTLKLFIKNHLYKTSLQCGSLQACYLAKKGYKVDLYEAREGNLSAKRQQ